MHLTVPPDQHLASLLQLEATEVRGSHVMLALSSIGRNSQSEGERVLTSALGQHIVKPGSGPLALG